MASINTIIIQSLTTENTILKYKVEALSQLCEHHKSKYEQLSAKYKYESDYQRYKFEAEVEALKSKLTAQSLQITTHEHQIANLKQDFIRRENIHKRQITNMEQSLHQQLITIEKFQQQIKDRNFEISMLRLDAAENAMHAQYAQYAEQQAASDCVCNNNNNGNRSPSTIAINAAHTISFTSPQSYQSYQSRLSCVQKNSLSSWKQQYLLKSQHNYKTPKFMISHPKPYKLRPESSDTFHEYDCDIDSSSESSEITTNHDAIDINLDKPDNEMMSKPSPLLILKSRSSFSSAMLPRVLSYISSCLYMFINIRIYLYLYLE